MLRRRCGEEGSAGIESAMLNQLMKDVGSKAWNNANEVLLRVEPACEVRLAADSVATTTSRTFRHEPPMIRVTAVNKQS